MTKRGAAHGTVWGYNSGCRCEFCTAAARIKRLADRDAEPRGEWWPTCHCAIIPEPHRYTGPWHR